MASLRLSFLLTEDTLWSRLQSQVLSEIQRADDEEVTGKVAGRSNRVIRTEASAIVATQPDKVTDKTATKRRQTRESAGAVGRKEPQFTCQPHHHQRHADSVQMGQRYSSSRVPDNRQ